MSDSDNAKGLVFISLAAAAFLFLAPLSLPYGYYTLLRLVITIIGGIFAVIYFMKEHSPLRFALTFLFGFIALLFNPIVPVYLSREVWLPINLLVGAVFLVNAWIIRSADKK